MDLKITKLGPKLSTYRWGTLYIQKESYNFGFFDFYRSIFIIQREIVSDLCPHIFDTYFLAKSWNGLYYFARKHLPAVGIIMPLFCICCKIFKYDSSRSFRLPIELFYCLAWVYTVQAAVWFMVNIVGSFDILFRYLSFCLFVTRVAYVVAISALPDQSNQYLQSSWWAPRTCNWDT